MGQIEIQNAFEGNLKNISLEIPKNKLVVFTGVSGSGKSTLVMDVLFNECQRQYLEAISLEGIHKPKVERIRAASPAVAVCQSDPGKNPRSTVGTVSDVYTDLRMIYEKLGLRTCPFCGKKIYASECKEETEKSGNDFYVYMYCSECGERMDKITRTHFSFNTKEGACKTCDGLGKVHRINRKRTVDETLSLEQGALCCFEKQYAKYQITVLHAAYRHFGIPIPVDKKVGDFSEIQKAMLLEGIDSEKVKALLPGHKPPKTTAGGKFEGVFPVLWRRFAEKNGDGGYLSAFFDSVDCPDCEGERLNEISRGITVHGTRLPQLSSVSLEGLREWIEELRVSLGEKEFTLIQAYIQDIETKLNRFIRVGLGYLSLDRQSTTLSGGEMQRLKLAALLDSDLSGVIYILDEPTVGLHPKDTAGLVSILKKLRDLENTILVIEHDVDVMKAADYIVDIGPGAGKYGGQVVAAGAFEDLIRQEGSVTAAWIQKEQRFKTTFRKPGESLLCIRNADKFNLKNLIVDIPVNCFTAVTGPSGSGKSTLIFEVLAQGGTSGEQNDHVRGLENFDRVVAIRQSGITRMKRSNIATYSEIYAEIRSVFAATKEAKAAGLSIKHFSFNTPGGRCENCEGLGYVDSNMLFFSDIQITCPVCGGKQFGDAVLAIKYRGLSIKEVLSLSVEEALDFFGKNKKIVQMLQLLQEVGLGYLELGQTLTTLSGGEAQRLKLAKELIGSTITKPSLYLLDEPTTGLHPKDVEHFLVLLNRLTDAGNTVVVVEHNQQLIAESDWVIDLGPEGGDKGGRLMYAGRPKRLITEC